MAELLLELLSEEIPARMQRRAAKDLQRLVTDALKKARLDFTSAEAYVTPRRLVLVVDGLPKRQPDLREERKGPKVGAPDKAIAGFLRGAGLDSLDQCEKRETAKGEAWFAVIEREGAATGAVFPELLNEILAKFPWPKSMRWGTTTQRWVRPVQGVLCVFDGDVVENVGFNDIVSGNETVGHRFVSPDPIAVTSFDDYREKLRAASVMIDPAERRAVIEKELEELAAAEGLTVKDDPALLDEVAGLVEWPVPLLGDIDADFMDLPAEALTSSMRAHQKYFALLRPDGSLAPRFGFVANIAAADGGAAIIAGNERVLRARLADAKFFWDTDRKTPLADRADALQAIVFHARLGSVAEKVERIAALAADLAGDANADDARRAALLCKADLVTGMVAEFPDLQGVMGRYYALADGEAPAVADAIADHYAPQGPGDRCPAAPVSVAVALADKIDTLAGFWLIDQKPTGSKDPYALRRAALGVIRLILENGLRINLIPMFEAAMRRYRQGDPAASGDLLGFFADRLKVHLREQGVRHDLIAAVFALGDEDDLVRLLARVEALGAFLSAEDGENLLVAYRRAANIVRIESKKDGGADYRDVSADLFAQPEENALWKNLLAVQESQKEAFAREQFDTAMAVLASLRPDVDRFFDQVTVNIDETKLRENRLALLKTIVVVMNRSADFSQIEG